jgi:hypothetical protein
MSTATANDLRVLSCAVELPAKGIWHADVETDGDEPLSGAVTIKLADATFVGTMRSGGVRNGRGTWKIVGGKGGWASTVKRKGYTSDAGVKIQTVIEDAARDAGETLRGTTSTRLGSHYTRVEGLASESLALLDAWYVDVDGATVIGARAASSYTAALVVKEKDDAGARVKVAADSIVGIVPGATIDGIVAVDVRHTLDTEGLRTTVWGDLPSNQWRSLILAALPQLRYAGMFEYRVVSQEGMRLNLQCTRVSTGLPDLRRVPFSPGIPGASATVTPGCVVLVAFVNSDPSRPVVIGFADFESPGHPALIITLTTASLAVTGAIAAAGIAAPLSPPAGAPSLEVDGGNKPINIDCDAPAVITLAGGIQGVARIGDAVQVNPATGTGTIIAGSARVFAG